MFWADTLSLCEPALVDPIHIAGSKQVTDAYLLGPCRGTEWASGHLRSEYPA